MERCVITGNQGWGWGGGLTGANWSCSGDHFKITASPTAAWTGQQFIEAFPWDTVPRFLLRDRDGIYGGEFVRRVASMGIEQVPISARSPWQNPYVERVIGSIRRECLDHLRRS